MSLWVWFILLIAQNAAFTWVGRARNSGSLGYHATASVFSNSIWFVSQFLFIGMMVQPGMNGMEAFKIGAIYTTATVIGSVGMHWVTMKYLETGKRKVGA